MATISFDTHKFILKLEAAGLSIQQAEAIADAVKEAQGEADLVTKKDLQIELAPIKSDLSNLRLRTPGVSPGVKASQGWEGFYWLCC